MLKFIASTTTIPVPKFLDLYEENGLLHLKTERVSGMSLDDIASEAVIIHVANYLESYVLPQLLELRHHTIGSADATLPVIPPRRITYRDERSTWPRKTSYITDFMFRHNDLGQHYIIVDPSTLDVTAIIDWEFVGYYTTEFKYPIWLKPVAEQGEDRLQPDHLIKFLDSTSESPKAADTNTLVRLPEGSTPAVESL